MKLPRISLLTLLLLNVWLAAGIYMFVRGFDAIQFILKFPEDPLWGGGPMMKIGGKMVQRSELPPPAAPTRDLKRAVATGGGHISLYDLAPNKHDPWNGYARIWSAGIPKQIVKVRFVENEKVIEGIGWHGEVYYLDAATGKVIEDPARIAALQKSIPPAMGLVSLDGRREIVDDGEKRRLIDRPSGRTILDLGLDFASPFTRDGRFVRLPVLGTPAICSADDGAVLQTLRPGNSTNHCAFSDDERVLLIPRNGLYLRRWPEGWWGQLTRAEVWIVLLGGIGLILRALPRFRNL